MTYLDKRTGELIPSNVQGLWARQPIPAIRVLGKAREYKALTLLNCLISHLGVNGYEVWPSYTAITRECGLSRKSIKRSIEVLVDFGYVKVTKRKSGKHWRNIYIINECSYDYSKMKPEIHSYIDFHYKCQACRKSLCQGSFGEQPDGQRIHFGCGGKVFPLRLKSAYKTA